MGGALMARVFHDDAMTDEAAPWIEFDARDGRHIKDLDCSVALALMIAAGEVYVGQDMRPYVLCSDTFAYACADGEDISDAKDFQRLFEMWEADKRNGAVRWCILRRRCRPIEPVVERMKREGAWDDVLEAACSEAK
jgi:hypothetical protein